ncbi:hypothetical protein ACWDUN_23060 [Mycobacterium sp. NPDC003323]
MTVVQLDLFGEIEAAELADAAARDSAAMQAAAFLVETPWPDLLAWWIHTDATESRLDHGECKASYRRSPDGSPGWAWAIWRDGLRFEAGDSWAAAGGWRHRPRWCIPWVELRAFRNAHPEVTARLQELAAGRGDPHARGWRWWIPPHGLRPDGMHESYMEGEQDPAYYDGCQRSETAWRDRLAAWRLVLDTVRSVSPMVVLK